MKKIAHIKSVFPTKFGIPHQSNRIEELKSTIIFEPEYRVAEAFRGLEEYDYIWLIWEFSESKRDSWSPTVRPPRLGGNVRKGVFATRSPFRPNPIGLSSVKLEKLEFHPELGPILHVSGADLMDGTPIYDIKPYIAYADCHPEATEGFAGKVKEKELQVEFPEELLVRYPEEKRAAILGVLAQDPRPAYDTDETRVYGVEFAGYDVRFTVKEEVLKVKELVKLNHR